MRIGASAAGFAAWLCRAQFWREMISDFARSALLYSLSAALGCQP